jgi:amino acid transporter
MKTTSVSIVVAAILLVLSARPAAADSDSDFDNTGAVAADALIARPLCFVATLVGTGLFIATLPIAVISRSVSKSANALVATPARLTFARKLGDFSEMN